MLKQNKVELYWLVTSYSMLIILILVGGLTRLTDSGLSITNWQIFSGIFPPLSTEEWIKYFNLYKQIPEFKEINFDMSLTDFKIIFWWEYAHRILARLTVLTFLIPFIFLLIKKRLNNRKIFTGFLISIMFFVQGFFGWYMVKSGLVNNVDVSHFRLSLHLITAIIIYSLIFWLFLDRDSNLIKFRFNLINYSLIALLIMSYIQIILGAFVSGLDAGLIYQTWPLMNENFIAEEIQLKFIASYSSLSEHAYVQFYHRVLAYFLILIFIFIYIKNINLKVLNNFYLNIILIVISLQVILGILTLVSGLNIFLASFHQIGSILLISSILLALYKLNVKIN